MFKFAFFGLLAVLVLSVHSAPVSEFEEELIQVSEHGRVKRATCDLLSFEAFGIKLNDSACAAHCLQLGRRGGHCNDEKVCVCRR
ncbi:hypothetical protein GWI33_019784 [Rhynchophorus ferrugineus]|uniref:Invertebrate defensins family profile domain-containing protein n=1 Tax=Rhynchophorus ferrugineus TaxID=354439 RepID=A0A834HXL8_RHYFE|nr:hypothetical protein GWI33_019784 [Rhynchophorus ferrugineus]